MSWKKYSPVFISNILSKNIKKFISGNRIKSAGRFIKNDEFSIVGESHCNHKLHLHAFWEIPYRFIFRKFKFFKVFWKLLTVPLSVKRTDLAFNLSYIQMFSKIKLIKNNAKTFLDFNWIFYTVEAKNAYFTAVDICHIKYRTDCCCLSRTVLPYKSHNISFGNWKAYIFQCKIIIAFAESTDFKNVLHAIPP